MFSTAAHNGFFMHTDKETQQPIIQPLKSIAEVEQWKPGLDFLCTPSVDLKSLQRLPSRPRTLLCHDMKGGYLEDRFVQGVKTTDCYRFYYWSRIDVFVYFSHYFVTIPPPCWTNAAHINGVPVLGTLITEWDSGKEICKEFLRTEETIHRLVKKLVSIARYYRFDGWLINIENEIPEEDVPRLITFVRHLTEQMKSTSLFALVIWYDSVILSGKLEWQNELNTKNKQFFDVCDGIFLNYVWKEGNLEKSKLTANERYLDVYVGIDVFGRGCKGGGGFNTIDAVQDARTNDLSVALFAPGWAFEKFGNHNFLENEKQFWELVNVGCQSHELLSLPVMTSFCQGWGDKLHVSGQPVSADAWTNMCQQNLQPVGPQVGLIYDQMAVFSGGGCLRVTCTEILKPVNSFKLFDAAVWIPRNRDLYLSYTYSNDFGGRSALMLELFSGKTHYLIASSGHPGNLFHDACPSPELCLVASQLVGDQKPHDIIENQSDFTTMWKTDWFKWHPNENYKLLSISLLLECAGPYAPANSICLGSLRVLPSDYIKVPNISMLRAFDISCSFTNNNTDHGISVESSMTLSWKCNMDVDYFVLYHEDNDEWKPLGTTCMTAYRVCKFICNNTVCRFKIQAVYCAGACIPLKSAASLSVIFAKDKYSVFSSA